MPPWLDTPEEVGAILVAVLGVLGTIGAGIVMSVAGVLVAAVKIWRSKVKPVLTSTQAAAETAADQLTPNHGSSARDSLSRIERMVSRLDTTMNQRITDIRADVRAHVDHSDRAHSEIFKRLRQIETPSEDTRP